MKYDVFLLLFSFILLFLFRKGWCLISGLNVIKCKYDKNIK